jgi:hypothetical protein
MYWAVSLLWACQSQYEPDYRVHLHVGKYRVNSSLAELDNNDWVQGTDTLFERREVLILCNRSAS